MTTGFNVGNCGQPAGGGNVHITDGTLTFQCSPSVSNRTISSQPVSYTQQVGCGDNHAALVTITCAGSGQPGNIAISGAISFSLSSSCNSSQNGQDVPSSDNDGNNEITWNFGPLAPGATATNEGEVCDLFSNACAADPCNFNEFSANVAVSNSGGY